MATKYWNAILSLLLLWAFVFPVCSGLPTLAVVGLFDQQNAGLSSIFERSALVVNDQQADVDIRPLTLIAAGSMHTRTKQLCQALNRGVVSVIGVQEYLSDRYGRSICDTAEVPYIGVRWDITNRNDALVLNLFPEAVAFSKPFTDLIRHWGWTSFTILYERSEELLKFQDLFKAAPRFQLTLRQLDGSNYRDIFREIRASGDIRIILDCHASRLEETLRHAQQLRLLTRHFQYILTTLDVHTVDLSAFVYDHAKITSFQLIDFDAKSVHQLNQEVAHGSTKLTTEEALIHDAVLLITKAFSGEDLTNIQPYFTDCNSEDSWAQGSEVFNALSHMEFDGITGTVVFDSQGSRSDFRLSIVQATTHGPRKVGQWTTNGTVEMGPRVPGPEALKGRQLHAITVLEDPYVMLKPDHEVRTGNDRYQGFAVDLMDKITAKLEINYTLEDKGKMGGHGVFNETSNSWNGLIGELINRRGDVAVGGITITDKREQVVDFTKPFMHVGISILYKKPEKQAGDLFSFLHPFSPVVWFYMMLAFAVVSLVIFMLGKFTPYEWYNPHPCNEHSDTVENMFTLGNSLWFTVGSLMQQGSDIAPRAVSTRVIAGSWWFFTLIMIASYTANLAAFLAVERTDRPIKGAEDLARQETVKYGVYKGGATYNFFATTKHPVYHRMWTFMNKDPNNFYAASAAAVTAVKTGKFAYLMELPSLEYTVNQACDLEQLGGLLDSKGYGLVTPPNSPFRDIISKEILRLQENSELQVLKDKWWRGKPVICPPEESSPELGMGNVGGVFIVLVAGIGIATLCALMEFSWNVRKLAQMNGMPFWQQFRWSFMEALLLRSNRKYSHRRRQRGALCCS